MGISGLLPLLKSIQKPCSLKDFAGKTIGVDAYGWLHRGTVSCAIELAQGKPTTRWLDYVMHKVRMLMHFGITPYLVFDGDYLPGKSGTEKDRAVRRRESRRTGLELLRLGRTSQAHLELQKSIDVTPEMARQLIEELKKLAVSYVVAPYEADSQMAYLEQRGIIHAILSEDSDLLVFGAQCLLTKLDQYGNCIMINRKDFTACREISLVGWTNADFRSMAIMSGCDYLPGIEKMGLKTAYRLLRKHKSVDRVVRAVQFDGKMKVPAGYLDSFDCAEATFLYQWVFCPEARRLVHFNTPPPSVDMQKYPCIGKYVEPEVAAGVAEGHLHPHTKEPIVLPSLPSYSRRPPLRNNAAVSTPDLKKHRSIETFFQPRRTPLAELDPNSFTPSPSQQRLLEQQSQTSWSAEPIARQPLLQPRTGLATPVSDPPRVRRAVTDIFPRGTHVSPKRQRLCSETPTSMLTPLDAPVRVEACTSRFFGSSASKQSPSLQRGGSAKAKNASEEFNLWSDDSVEQAMSQLPEPVKLDDEPALPISKKKKTKVAVFVDDAAQNTSDLRARFMFNSSAQGGGADAHAQADQNNMMTPTSRPGGRRTQSARYTRTPRSASPPRPPVLVACSSPPAVEAADAEPASEEQVDGPGEDKTSRLEDSAIGMVFDEAEWRAANARILTARDAIASEGEGRRDERSTVKSEQEHEKGIKQRGKVGGSEDLIIPDSEGEESSDEAMRVRHTGFSFDLARFAFAG